MQNLCGICRIPFEKPKLLRVGHRLVCGSCLKVLKQREGGTLPPLSPHLVEDLRRLQRLERYAVGAGIAAKAVFFLLFFWWASESTAGRAALRGALAADILTWVLFRISDWQYSGFRLRAGGLFELVLIVAYLNREPLFAIREPMVDYAMVLLFFMLFAVIKIALWGAEHAVVTTGVKERA